MAYLRKIWILTADEAKAGEQLNVYIAIENPMDYNLYVTPLLYIDGLQFEGSYDTIPPWEDIKGNLFMTEYGLCVDISWKFTFTMPSKPVTVKCDVWMEQEYLEIPWHLDISASKAIALKEVPPEFANFAIDSYELVLT